jgi:hypothetical protein
VPDITQAAPSFGLTHGLCALILAVMIAAVAYAIWIGVLNFARIGV